MPGWLEEFQSLNRAYKRSDGNSPFGQNRPDVFQSLNRAYKRSDPGPRRAPRLQYRFQSLNRAYKRSDTRHTDLRRNH